jgi:hypothetical protein
MLLDQLCREVAVTAERLQRPTLRKDLRLVLAGTLAATARRVRGRL